ncbi:MAG: flagellar export chaperone FliS [Granulosicoccus sp.]|nr:flagellar export chaperone FliS [Granulosicoccus sp.]
MTVHAYKAVKRVSMVEGTTPHQLISLLYEASLSQIAMAQQHLVSNDHYRLHQCVDKAIAIVQELQASLLNYQSDELAGNLFELYSYIVRTLIQSQAKYDAAGFSTCKNLLEILQDAWEAISPERATA